LLGSLHSSSTIICQERFEAEEALMIIERERATHVSGWPTLVQTLKSHPKALEHDLSSLVAVEQPSQLRSSRGDPINMGMTETFGMHRNRDFFDYKIIDPATGGMRPNGEEGEFCVRGFGLTAGLYGLEREEVFDQEGWYHTGDRGYLEDGEIYYTGRYSEMIKTAGANVSPLEVETALLAQPEIAGAFVVGIAHPARGEEVVAVVVGASADEIDAGSLRERLGALLSSYKVPTRYVQLEDSQLPTLSSGKVDKRRLATMLAAPEKPPVAG
jgi:acyl-CoA synthetase (AMP-forming)/AMP-acid ligase II